MEEGTKSHSWLLLTDPTLQLLFLDLPSVNVAMIRYFLNWVRIVG